MADAGVALAPLGSFPPQGLTPQGIAPGADDHQARQHGQEHEHTTGSAAGKILCHARKKV
jgi:hypothetical protein